MNLIEIYDQYYQRIRKFILHTVKNEWLADDLVQETFIRISNNLKSVRDTSKLRSWIFRIAYNICQDYFRSQVKSSSLEEEEVPEETTPGNASKVHKTLEQYQMRKCIQNQINHLPNSLRSVIILSDIEEFSHQEIAAIIGITVDNVKVRLHRARKKLKILLEERCVFEVDDRNVLTCVPILSGNGINGWRQYLP